MFFIKINLIIKMSSPLSSIMCTEEEEEVVVKHLQQQRKNSIDGGRRVE